jgi:predicted Zn-dependent protease
VLLLNDMRIIWFISLLCLGLSACKKVPITGRKQMTLIRESELVNMSEQEYRKFLADAKVLKGTQDAQRVERIGQQIAAAVEHFYRKNKTEDKLKDFAWEFTLVDDPTVNAWCMPGGKVVFYSGILPVCLDDDGLAVVMGHEVAHAVAQHGNERMSQGLMAQMGAVALSVATSSQPEATQNLFMQAYGAGATVGVLLPFSRKHETEADRLGLVFMAMAGFNPDKAPEFWERMAALSGGAQPPVFVSSHPSNEQRIKDLKNYIPVAKRFASEYGQP